MQEKLTYKMHEECATDGVSAKIYKNTEYNDVGATSAWRGYGITFACGFDVSF